MIYCKYYCTSVASCLIISLPILLEQSCGQSQDTWKDKKSGSSPPVFYPNAPFFTSRVIKPTALSSLFQKKTQENEFIWVKLLNPIQGGPFGAAYEGGLKNFLTNIWHTYPTMMKLQWLKKHTNHIFSPEIGNFCYIKKSRYRLHVNT